MHRRHDLQNVGNGDAPRIPSASPEIAGDISGTHHPFSKGGACTHSARWIQRENTNLLDFLQR